MARTARLFIENACHHVIARGNRKQTIFKDRSDFERFLGILKKAKKRYDIRLYTYCLMPNHVHLLLESKASENISLFMHWLNRGYAAYFNDRYNTVGHVWQGRFVSRPIVKGAYLINCATYIEANPVRAGLVDDIAEYPWSSYVERCLSPEKILLDEIDINECCEALGTV